MASGNTITAVIPVHNRADLLAELLASIAAQSRPFDEVLVVDNASTDGASAIARERGARVLAQASNAGFAAAVNTGWRAARESRWIAILNSDVTLDPQWLERLMAEVSCDNRAAFATGTIYDAADDCAIDGTYDLLGRSCCAWRAGHGERKREDSTESVTPIAIAPGTACLFRRDVLERLNGFDESFGSYLEDVDLGLRCIREGYSGIFVPMAVARHRGSATLGRWNPRVVRLISRNQVLLIRRHYDSTLFRSCLWPILVGQVLWGLVAIRHGASFAWLSGKLDGLKSFHLEGRPSPGLREFLLASEREIRKRATDPYWRWYFRLTAAGAD